jgi:protein-L-isoaspartate(D-aspartate) O-methyltransferase
MVEQLRVYGVSDATLTAFAHVPRHKLVPYFWTVPMTIGGRRTRPIEHRRGDTKSLRVLHDIERALAVNQVPDVASGTTSTASAPRLLAEQADLLALQPGMSVLEIGTGPGYFAAILSELVGPDGRVFTIDIDGAVAAEAAERLDALGYTNVTVFARDGHLGAPEQAPFDRVAGSVGANDIAAAWLAQLVPDGFALVPLRHGGFHPTMRVDAPGHGAVVIRSGYVAIQGAQSDTKLWPFANAAVSTPELAPLPPDLRPALTIEPGRERMGGLGEWNLGYWVAAADSRAGVLAELNDGAGSTARVDARAPAIAWGGPAGRALAGDLLAHAREWKLAGAPRAEDFEHRFVPLGTGRVDAGFVISRIDHDQVITR